MKFIIEGKFKVREELRKNGEKPKRRQRPIFYREIESTGKGWRFTRSAATNLGRKRC